MIVTKSYIKKVRVSKQTNSTDLQCELTVASYQLLLQ